MNKLYQDDFLYDKKVLLNGKYKLQSLLKRTDSCSNVNFEPFMLGNIKKKQRGSQQHLTQVEKEKRPVC